MDLFNNSKTAMRKDVLMALASKNPVVFARVLTKTSNAILGEVITDAEASINAAANSESWFDKILKGMSAIGLVLNQREINKINLERVKQGKEPLSTDITGQTVNLGLADQTRKTLLYVAGGLGVLLAIVLLRKKR